MFQQEQSARTDDEQINEAPERLETTPSSEYTETKHNQRPVKKRSGTIAEDIKHNSDSDNNAARIKLFTMVGLGIIALAAAAAGAYWYKNRGKGIQN